MNTPTITLQWLLGTMHMDNTDIFCFVLTGKNKCVWGEGGGELCRI